MATKTKNYGLNKHSPQDFYDVNARNENWDKIDEALASSDPTKAAAKSEPADGDGVLLSDSAASGGLKRLLWSNVKTALGKVFVPLARKVNGKSLGSDVTLTGDDIALGSDDSETLRAAMAKRVKAEHFLPSEDSLDSAIVSGMYRCSTNSGLPDEGASYGQLLVVHGGYDTIAQVYFPWDRKTVYIRSGAPASIGGNNNWLDWWAVPRVEKPEVHELLLVSGVTPEKSCVYYKSQENLVVGQLDLQASAAAYQEIAVALLPEGFRPSRDTPFMVSSCARKGVVWEGTGWGRISSDGYIHLYQNIAWGWAQAQFSFIAD